MILDSANLDIWSGFHRDLEGARTRYLAMVGRVAARMSSHRNVIGYELMNEPWGQARELQELFEDVGAAIRASDPERMLFVPGHALGWNAPRVSHSNIVHAPHFYEPGVYVFKAWGGGSLGPSLDELHTVSQRQGSPMLLGEFGVPEGTQQGAPYLEAIYTWLDERFVSATQWNYTPGWTPAAKDGFNAEDFSIVGSALTLRPGLFTPRPYPQKTAGEPISFQRTAEGFTYRWRVAPELGATELFLLEGQALAEQTGVALTCIHVGQLLSCTGSEAGEASVAVKNR
jgi:hypothetical protein